ncbi:MAG: hypothetical protein K6F23_15690 [Solobacterium sp.]|nr:hypothetical protein [Solobacterium sp.]
MKKNPDVSRQGLRMDILKEYYAYDITPEEYMKFGFAGKNDAERRTFCPGYRNVRAAKTAQNSVWPENKYERYLMIKDYVKRDVVYIRNDENMEQNVKAFAEKYSRFVGKPVSGSKGHGIISVNADDTTLLEEKIRSSKNGYMLEEMIIQADALARFHPGSVNTIRFVSAADKNGEIRHLFALLRTGRGGSFVDNIGSGGMAAAIDLQNGVVYTDGINGDMYYKAHPDTGVVFRGAVIPEWKELLNIVDQVHSKYSSQKMMGFDFAYSDKGWDIVEINPAPSVRSFQAISGEGMMPVLKEIGLFG